MTTYKEIKVVIYCDKMFARIRFVAYALHKVHLNTFSLKLEDDFKFLQTEKANHSLSLLTK